MAETADILKKITLSIEPEPTGMDPNFTIEPHQYAFIFGIGSHGLAPVEYALAGKTVGEEVCLRINPSNIRETFQHLSIPHLEVPDASRSDSYRIKIVNIDSADSREIVTAMAQQSSCTDCCGH